jgi:hypothetical protein
MTKLLEVETIYAQMSEFSDKSFRPHPWVMGFLYNINGGVTVWWDHAHESEKFSNAKLDLVDWMHENGLIADSFIKLIPLPEEKNLTLPGVLILWRPEGQDKAGVYDLAKDYIEGLTNATQQ